MDMDETPDRLIEAASDPEISGDLFDELVRRIKVLLHLREN